MIRKLKSGEYRLYSRKKDPKTGKRRNLGTFDTKEARRSTSARSNISSVTNMLTTGPDASPLRFPRWFRR